MGSAPILKYEIEWDSTDGVSEQQIIELSTTAGTLSGYFTLSFEGHTTGSIEWDASAENLKLLLQRLPAIGVVDVSRVNVPVGNGFKWTVTFASNVGDVSQLKLQTSLLTGAKTTTVTEYLKGADPSFDEGTIGIATKALGRKDMHVHTEVQSISTSTAA